MSQSSHERTIGSARLTLVRGDITEQTTDAIVNAANSTLMGGGGVDGAIHHRGGPQIRQECERLRETRFKDGLPTGQAVATTAGRLSAMRVIHTVGPIWHGGARHEAVLLADAWRNSLDCARDQGLRTVAFPSISTGAYGFPIDRAARIAIETVRDTLLEHPDAFDEVRIVLFSASDLETYAAALESIERGGD
jgi:O-acetyl-ADP-ribose deacetylase